MNRESAKKRLMFIQKEDYNFLTYILLVLLNNLDCTSSSKKFRDFRKVAYLVDFINNGGNLLEYTKEELANIYYKAQLKKQLIHHLLIILKNRQYLEIEINNTHNTFDIWINKDNIPSDFFNKEIFSRENDNITILRGYFHSLKTVKIKDLVDKLYTNNNVLTWEV